MGLSTLFRQNQDPVNENGVHQSELSAIRNEIYDVHDKGAPDWADELLWHFGGEFTGDELYSPRQILAELQLPGSMKAIEMRDALRESCVINNNKIDSLS